MINQRSQILNRNIQEFGCLFLCYLELARRRLGLKLNEHVANIFYDFFVKSEAITPRCRVNRPDAIFVALGAELNGWIRREAVEYMPRMYDEAEVQEWHNARTGHTHFILPDYDPLGSSVTVKEGKMISKIIVRFAK